jgi:hypothetical protein
MILRWERLHDESFADVAREERMVRTGESVGESEVIMGGSNAPESRIGSISGSSKLEIDVGGKDFIDDGKDARKSVSFSPLTEANVGQLSKKRISFGPVDDIDMSGNNDTAAHNTNTTAANTAANDNNKYPSAGPKGALKKSRDAGKDAAAFKDGVGLNEAAAMLGIDAKESKRDRKKRILREALQVWENPEV